MTESISDLGDYARRIGYEGPLRPTLQTLTDICWLHQVAIPFENLDIVLLRRPISLSPSALMAKMVRGNRGGFCFEQNRLLAMMLTQIGFQVRMGYATWQPDNGPRIVPFDHMALGVRIPGDERDWLADAGFGRESPAGPVPLHSGQWHCQRTGVDYRISALDDPDLQWSIEWRAEGETWRSLYDLDLRPRRIGDYEHRSHFNQTSPESHFTRGIVCSRPLPEGRVTVTGDQLIRTLHGHRTESPIDGLPQLLETLQQWFGIRIIPADLP